MIPNQHKLVSWLKENDDINSKLLLAFLQEETDFSTISREEIDDIFPELLIELTTNDTFIVHLKQILAEECQSTSPSEFGFRIIYIKDRLQLLHRSEKESFLHSIKSNIHYSLLSQKMDIDTLYSLYFWSHYTTEQSVCQHILYEIITSFLMYFARNYQLCEFVLCVLILLNVNKSLPSLTKREIYSFITTLQNDKGYFGYNHPFLGKIPNSQLLKNTFYCVWCLSLLQEEIL